MSAYTRWYVSPLTQDAEGVYRSGVEHVFTKLGLTPQEHPKFISYNRPGTPWTVAKVLAPAQYHDALLAEMTIQPFGGKLLSDGAAILSRSLRDALSVRGLLVDVDRDAVGDVIERAVRWHEPAATVAGTIV